MNLNNLQGYGESLWSYFARVVTMWAVGCVLWTVLALAVGVPIFWLIANAHRLLLLP